MSSAISLAPLTEQDHTTLVQQVYAEAPGFWRMHGLDKAPEGQAQRDLHEAEKTPGRTIMGVTRRVVEDNPESGHEIIGIVDFRLNWPEETTAYLGILLIAEPVQRQGFGTQALDLLQPWLASAAGIERMRLGVEQYNTNALLFFQRMGFTLTGETNRVQVGDRWVRLLFMEKDIGTDFEQSRTLEDEDQI